MFVRFFFNLRPNNFALNGDGFDTLHMSEVETGSLDLVNRFSFLIPFAPFVSDNFPLLYVATVVYVYLD